MIINSTCLVKINKLLVMKEREYQIKFRLNGKIDTYYVTATEANYTESEIKGSVIQTTKKELNINKEDDFKIINVKRIR